MLPNVMKNEFTRRQELVTGSDINAFQIWNLPVSLHFKITKFYIPKKIKIV